MTIEAPFLSAEWRQLLMVNFEVESALLKPLVPRGTTLDPHEGITWVSLVAFQFLDTRVRGIRIPFHHSFEEVNLRFYVRRMVDRVTRRGVVFIRELVPRRAIAWFARVMYNEPYRCRAMRSSVTGMPPNVRYEWRAGRAGRAGERWETLAAKATGDASVPVEGTHRSFITEHYWGYTRQRDGGTIEYRVTHPRWRVWEAELTSVPDLEPVYGAEWSRALSRPLTVLIAEGSPVDVFRGVRLSDTAP